MGDCYFLHACLYFSGTPQKNFGLSLSPGKVLLIIVVTVYQVHAYCVPETELSLIIIDWSKCCYFHLLELVNGEARV